MKKALFSAIAFLMMMAPSFSLFSQTNSSNTIGLSIETVDRYDDFKKKKKKKKKKGDEEAFNWKRNVWIGSGLSLGLAASSGGGTQWQMGLSPMAGYKILPWFSVGPRVGYFFGQARFDLGGGLAGRQNFSQTHIGAIARAKVWRVFLHLENSYFWQKVTEKGGGQTFPLLDESYANQFIGIGYNPSEGRNNFAMEYLLVVNVREAGNENSTQLPIEYRIGLTYNF